MEGEFRIDDFVSERRKDPEVSGRDAQKRIAAINDMSGFGKCSLTVALPIISAMGIQCCPLPTAIYSNQTGYPSFFYTDYTPHLEAYIAEWKKLNLHFDGIVSGFLGSSRQIDIVRSFIRDFGGEGACIIVDPVMGDAGRLYSTITVEMAEQMKDLVCCADLVTPNLTEACILTQTGYREDMPEEELDRMAQSIAALGPDRVVITGITEGEDISNFCYQKGQGSCMVSAPRIGPGRSGTGDIFTAILAADAVNVVPFIDSVRKATSFICTCIERSAELDIPLNDGVVFEEFLCQLVKRSGQGL